jgi:hypothetical protein
MTTAAAVSPGRQKLGIFMRALIHAVWNTRTLGVLCVIALVWVMGCGFIYSKMRKPPEEFGRFMMKLPGPVPFLAFPFETMWMRARAGTLEVGDRAPDFRLSNVDHNGRVQLSELNRTQPVVLVFGSYT